MCHNSLKPGVRWQSTDPKTGLDFYAFRQHDMWADSADACPENSYFVLATNTAQAVKSGKCYWYEILTKMCFNLEYQEHPENATVSWNYSGGCFADGSFAQYEPAVDGETYHFNYIPIEIRPSVTAESDDDDGDIDERADGGFFNLLGNVCLMAALALTIFLIWVVIQNRKRV